MTASIPRAKPSGALRLFLHMPMWFFQLGLGGFMPWWVMLTTVGRRTGQPRRVVLDIMKRDGQALFVLAAFGGNADWIQNLQARPALQAQLGWRTYPARATFLSGDSAGDFMADFYRQRPAYTRAVMRSVGETVPDAETARRLSAGMVLVRIEPAAG
jgi:deazaflavin-dependent oxidoreductase (nitroreductase family)